MEQTVKKFKGHIKLAQCLLRHENKKTCYYCDFTLRKTMVACSIVLFSNQPEPWYFYLLFLGKNIQVGNVQQIKIVLQVKHMRNRLNIYNSFTPVRFFNLLNIFYPLRIIFVIYRFAK